MERLGGEVRQGNAFDSSCTHVIVAKDQLRRTEKVLGALASGKPLLSEEFLEASDRAGAFVAEQRYECVMPHSADSALLMCVVSLRALYSF